MSGDHWNIIHDKVGDDLDRASRLWEVVYSRIETTLADIEAGRPTLEEDEAKDPAQARLDADLRDAEEVFILRECAYEIVQAALVALGAWK